MHYKVTHTTRYNYSEPVSLCHNLARLIPRSTRTQTCKSAELTIDPRPDILNEYEDFFGNRVTFFAIQQEHRSLTVTVSSEIVKTPVGALEFNLYEHESWESIKQQLSSQRQGYADIIQYIPETPMRASDPEIAFYTRQSFL